MRNLKSLIIVICTVGLAATVLPAAASGDDPGREVLAPNDGWASFGEGTTGGALATPDYVYTVTNRRELIAALNDGVYPAPSSTPSSVPKIIYVKGTLDLNVDDDDQPLTCEDYYTDGYTLEEFLATYDPEVWGREEEPSGPVEDARDQSRRTQEARIRIRVGSNTTLVGVGKHAVIRGAWLDLRGQSGIPGSRSNLIIRNINFQDTYDCFPEWDPTDGDEGSWNALYDVISLRDTDHVWIDHNVFENPETPDDERPIYFGVPFEVHDGQVDITNGSDFVTVSWNRFGEHNKTMLIGSSDGATADRGKLNVTLHHNLFENNVQRVPRVRFGKVHVYNNLYRHAHNDDYSYSWGVGIESAIYAENNVFFIVGDVAPAEFIGEFNGTDIFAGETLVFGSGGRRLVDVLAEYNAANEEQLGSDVGWAPSLFTHIEPSGRIKASVLRGSGPFNWKR